MKTEIEEMNLHGGDLNSFDVYCGDNSNVNDQDHEIWFKNEQDDNQLGVGPSSGGGMDSLLDVGIDVNDPTPFFYNDDFPPLPDFPCMSSSSSSSSAPGPAPPLMGPNKTFGSTATSSSASTASTSRANDVVVQVHASEMIGDRVDTECMDMMETFGCIDLLEDEHMSWDPSPLFEDQPDGQLLQQQQEQLERERERVRLEEERAFEEFIWQGETPSPDFAIDTPIENNQLHQHEEQQQQELQEDVQQPPQGQQQQQQEQEENKQLVSSSQSEELGMVFFEWLKCNRDTVSAEDLRTIKIKKATIELAAKRLGGGKEGMKQLLKLILQWVQTNHLSHKKMMMLRRNSSNSFDNPPDQTNSSNLNDNNNNNNNNNNNKQIIAPSISSNPNPSPNSNQSYGSQGHGRLVPTQPYVRDPSMVGPPPMGSGARYPPMEYRQMVDPAVQGWATSQYGVGPHYGPYVDPAHAAQFGGYVAHPSYPGFYYHPGAGDALMRAGSSATKEARKKRMARSRRYFRNHHQNNNQLNETVEHPGVGPINGNWVYLPTHQTNSMAPSLSMPTQMSQPMAGSGPVVGQVQPLERQNNNHGFQKKVEKKQGYKPEKNLRFLLQKVLKQSDVGNLGRIVLPKKEAETHLPELEARDGIPIAMEDIGTSRVWNMRYRFWPNNKSRMYLLENTGEFVRSNGLQEGDFIVIYSDVKCGKYMIRGVKVRPQQPGVKSEPTKKSSKAQKTQGTSTPSGNSCGPSSPANTNQK